MVIALAFLERIFAQSVAMNQAHGLIIAEVTSRVASARTRRSLEESLLWSAAPTFSIGEAGPSSIATKLGSPTATA